MTDISLPGVQLSDGWSNIQTKFLLKNILFRDLWAISSRP